MKTEKPEKFDPVAHANLILENYLKKRLTETEQKVREYMEGMLKPTDLEDLKLAILEANSYIRFTAGDDVELYEQYAYHLYEGASGIFMAQGKEVKGLGGTDERE